MSGIQKVFFFIESSLLLLTVAEYALFFIEAIIFADEKWDDHDRHIKIAGVLTGITVVLGFIYSFIYD